MVPISIPDVSVLENSRAFLSWLVSRASASRQDANKKRTRELAMTKRKTAAPAAEESDEEEEIGEDPLAEVESVSVNCCRLLERLEPGHAVLLRVDGELLEGAYSSGGAIEKKEELLEKEREPADGGTGGGGGSAKNTKATVEVVPWEAAGRMLLACPFEDKLPVLRCGARPYVPPSKSVTFDLESNVERKPSSTSRNKRPIRSGV